ncbi:hypothetical protein TUMEXPCC7403_22725 [Tumidithrix helvetica PCC 7403]|uniref:hypothetical protein n=1 Tax=Tumidithrix helvetica TaxID=3457545 RepID=UPI003C979475
MSQNDRFLDRQIALLIKNAPNDGATPGAVNLVATVLKAIAARLRHLKYFVIQDRYGGWLLNTLSNRESPDIEKTVVYAYCSRTTANIECLKLASPDIECVEYGIIDILFRLIGLKQVDSLIVFDHPTNAQQGTEIARQDLEKLCEKQIKRVKFSHRKLQEMKDSSLC